MTSKATIKRTFSAVLLGLIAASIFVLAPPAGRLLIALLTLPLEAMLLSSLLTGFERQAPQA